MGSIRRHGPEMVLFTEQIARSPKKVGSARAFPVRFQHRHLAITIHNTQVLLAHRCILSLLTCTRHRTLHVHNEQRIALRAHRKMKKPRNGSGRDLSKRPTLYYEHGMSASKPQASNQTPLYSVFVDMHGTRSSPGEQEFEQDPLTATL